MEASCSLRNVSSSRSSLTSFSAEVNALSFSANRSLSSFSLRRKSSRSSLSMPITVGVCGRLSISDLRPSKIGFTGVILLAVEGVGDEVGFLETPTEDMGLSGVAHSP